MDTASLTIIAVSILGLLTGSFANVAIHRLPGDGSIVSGRSACPTCGTQINGYDNIPLVSWLLLRGTCRSCNAPIRIRYPAIELLMGLLFAVVAAVHGPTPQLAALLITTWVVVVAAAIDLELRIIPNRLTYKAPVIILAALVTAAVVDRNWGDLARAVATSVALPGGMLALGESFRLVRGKRGIGLGDIKFAVSLGLMLGWLGGWQTIAALYATLGSAILVTILLMLRGKLSMAGKIPFGPHLAVGTMVAIVFGPQIEASARGLFG